MPVGKTLLLAVLLISGLFSGCTLLHQTHFTLLSLVVDDDQGFPRLYVRFNTSDTTVLTLTGPATSTLFTDTYYAGVHNESIYFSKYRTTIPPGTYRLEATDSSNRAVFEQEMTYGGENLSLTSLSVDGWTGETGTPIVTLQLKLKNSGDLPAYPYRLVVTQGSVLQDAILLPVVVLPSASQEITCFVPLLGPSPETDQLDISLYDNAGRPCLQTNRTMLKRNQIGSWEYTWYYLGSHSLKIPRVDWFSDYYKSLDRFDLTDYAAYVFDPCDDPYIGVLTHQILQLKTLHTDAEEINFVASFVQSIDYANDDPTNESYEYPRYPLETLHDRQGDCEDKAILTASLLQNLGYNVSLLRLPHHMAVGVHLNETLPLATYYVDQYYFLETTTLHMDVGKIPPEYVGLTNVTVYPLTPRPLLTHQWKNATHYTVSDGRDYVKVEMILENLGSGMSAPVEVRAAFYDNASYQYNQQTTIVSPLEAGEKRLVSLSVDVPAGVSTVLKTQVYSNGKMVDDRESTARFP